MSIAIDLAERSFPRARGIFANELRDCVYHISRSGQIYTTPWMSAEVSLRFYCVVALSARGAPFKIRINGGIHSMEAAALKAMVDRSVRTVEREQLVSFQIDPRHASYRAFRTIASPGILQLDRDAFSEVDDMLDAAYQGKLSIGDATELFNAVVSIATQGLPSPPPMDRRIALTLKTLNAEIATPLADLAKAAGLSVDRMSHLFAQTMGLPLKSYLLWRKLHCAVGLLSTGTSLTEVAHAAGFTDSAHLSKTFQQVYGAAPTYFSDDTKVKHIAPIKS